MIVLLVVIFAWHLSMVVTTLYLVDIAPWMMTISVLIICKTFARTVEQYNTIQHENCCSTAEMFVVGGGQDHCRTIAALLLSEICCQ